jgi:hypothetical protein
MHHSYAGAGEDSAFFTFLVPLQNQQQSKQQENCPMDNIKQPPSNEVIFRFGTKQQPHSS